MALSGQRLPLVFMVPDVGGPGLCCENINIIDSALLTNRFLAKYGYKKFPDLLQFENPDVIETHGLWSELTGIYDVPYFKENYVRIMHNKRSLWLNKKHMNIWESTVELDVTKAARNDINDKYTSHLKARVDEKYTSQ